MNSYDKKKATIEIYELMRENLETELMMMLQFPDKYVPEEYWTVPKINNDIKKIIHDAARTLHDEIQKRMLEIYRL